MSVAFELPQGWEYTTIGDLCETKSGGTPDRDNPEYYGGEIPWMKSGEMTDGPVKNVEESITEKGLQESSAVLFPEGTLVVALYGATSGKLGILQKPSATNQAICGIFPSACVERNYLFWYLLHIRGKLLEKRKGGAQANLSQTLIRETKLPLPPLPEQRRIVAKIEELFSNLDAGMGELSVAEQQLERYRLSVLQAAVEGRLTADWRRTHDPKPADQLLERILEERRAQWEKDYRAKYEAKGKDMPRYWKKRYSEPDNPDAGNLPLLPDGWTWTNVENACIVYGGVTKNARKGGDLVEMPYLRVANVYANELRLDEIKKIKVKRNRLYKYFLEEGDLLVVEGNGSKSQIGRVARWDGSVESCVHQNHLIKVRPIVKETGRYLLWWLLSPNGRRHITRVASSTSGLYTLSMTKVRSIPVPLPPLAEQKQIVAEIERLLSVAEDASATTKQEQTRAERLRQSILKQAFSGKLVPHETQHSTPEVPPESAVREGRQIEMEI